MATDDEQAEATRQARRAALMALEEQLKPLQPIARARLTIAAAHAREKHDQRGPTCRCTDDYKRLEEPDGLGEA